MEYWKKLVIALLVLLLGFSLAVGDTYWFVTENRVWLSIGCSLIASASVILLNVLLLERRNEKDTDKWGMVKIYATRAEKNKDSDPMLGNMKYKLDGIAFGLKTFRTGQSEKVEAALSRGVQIRLITMQPESPFVRQREIEEKEQEGQIKNTIQQLISWADSLNAKGYKGKIQIKGYSCMTLDFYWRMDDIIYMGPYWYGYSSQQTVTYRFDEGGIGFSIYEKYFEKLWNDNELMKLLTKKV